MIFTSEKKVPIKEKGKQYIFLAGSMDYERANSWRDFIIEIMKENEGIVFLDPTNIKHDELDKDEMELHVRWELEALEVADKIVLNFLPDSLSPISLVELGMYVKSNKLIVVCPEKFYKSSYVYTLCEKYKTPSVHKLQETLEIISIEK